MGDMNPLDQRSPFGGQLIEEVVSGAASGQLNPENNVEVAAGVDRTMFAYVPAAGCPHPKQTAVLMVLRDDASEQSARALMRELALDELAEREHFVLLFPNPAEGGWNYAADPERDDDAQFLVRCFACLKGSRGGVAGFNGMMYYLAATAAGSAMAWTLAQASPLDAAAVMLGAFPELYKPPCGKGAEQVAWLYEPNTEASAHLRELDGAAQGAEVEAGVKLFANAAAPAVRFFESEAGLGAAEVERAWRLMFASTRRWRNDVFGTYQPRPDFEVRGFVAHVGDTSLGLPDGLGRSWFEYVPTSLRGTSEPAPLVLYLHGINCCGLYGAEQSGWADIAERDGIVCVFPSATAEDRWNAWDDARIPVDIAYVMALIDHMVEVHPIDRSRIYLSGFSMGSMFSNALACSYPDVFAGVVALNGPNLAYFQTLDEARPGMLLFRPNSAIRELAPSGRSTSPTHDLALAKKERYDYRMPFVQFVGLLDGVGLEPGHGWPVTSAADGQWVPTLAFWKAFDGIEAEPEFSAETETGFASDYVERSGRFIHQSWAAPAGEDLAGDGRAFYHLVATERMPHAVDLEQLRIGWDIVRHYRREPSGALGYIA